MAVGINGFDESFYLARNRDVAAAGIDAYQHYLTFGWREGRVPNALFDPVYYLSVNRDVAAAGIDPLSHYVKNGWREGRDPSIAFDTQDYLLANADAAASGINPMIHYLTIGQFEDRPLAPDTRNELAEGFDRDFYLSANADVAAAGVDAYIHYVRFGRHEGRAPNDFFDERFYLDHNRDVAASGVDAFQHFLTFGWREGRDPSADLNLSDYRAATLLTANVNPLTSYLTIDRYADLPSDFYQANPPQVIQSRGSALSAILVGEAHFAIDGALTHVTAPSSPLDGHDLSGFTDYWLARSTADIRIDGTGALPLSISLGTGDDQISGNFTLRGHILNLFAGGGTLDVRARIDDGYASINGGEGGSHVAVSGSAQFSFAGAAGDDVVVLGTGNDTVSGGGGTNYLDGNLGTDTASWSAQVRADLLTGEASALGNGPRFYDQLVSIEGLGGSAFDDILLGDDGANSLFGVYISPSPSGNDLLAGRGGDDVLWGMDGDDILIGGRGADALVGQEGDDLLIDRADPWGAGARMATAVGNEGSDMLVYLLDAVGDIQQGAFMDGGLDADTYVIDSSQGIWGSVGLQFSQIDGDRLDLSALRTLDGQVVTLEYVQSAATAPFATSIVINLSAFEDVQGNGLDGRIVLNGLFSPSDLNAGDLILSAGMDWRAALPADIVALI